MHQVCLIEKPLSLEIIPRGMATPYDTFTEAFRSVEIEGGLD